MTDDELKTKYPYEKREELREAIKFLDLKQSRTEAENKLLEDLKQYRVRYFANDKLAWYTLDEIYYLFD